MKLSFRKGEKLIMMETIPKNSLVRKKYVVSVCNPVDRVFIQDIEGRCCNEKEIKQHILKLGLNNNAWDHLYLNKSFSKKKELTAEIAFIVRAQPH